MSGTSRPKYCEQTKTSRLNLAQEYFACLQEFLFLGYADTAENYFIKISEIEN